MINVSQLIATKSHGEESFWTSGSKFPSQSLPFSPVPITVRTSHSIKLISQIAWFLVSQTYMKCLFSQNTWHNPWGWWNQVSEYDPSMSPIEPTPITSRHRNVVRDTITIQLFPVSEIARRSSSQGKNGWFWITINFPGYLRFEFNAIFWCSSSSTSFSYWLIFYCASTSHSSNQGIGSQSRSSK